jgi:hypothetical protein
MSDNMLAKIAKELDTSRPSNDPYWTESDPYLTYLLNALTRELWRGDE